MPPKGCPRRARQHLTAGVSGGVEGLRVESGLSRREFAKRLGIPRSSYFHLMTSAANPSLDYIELIAERAGIDPLRLLRRLGSPAAGGRPEIRDTRAAR